MSATGSPNGQVADAPVSVLQRDDDIDRSTGRVQPIGDGFCILNIVGFSGGCRQCQSDGANRTSQQDAETPPDGFAAAGPPR